jgi:hypothetical protein
MEGKFVCSEVSPVQFFCYSETGIKAATISYVGELVTEYVVLAGDIGSRRALNVLCQRTE